jgi:Flp pilus assembly protein TadD
MTGRAREGLRVLDAVLKRAPDYEPALNERVALALALDNQPTDLALAQRAVTLNPWSSEFHEWLAYYQLENGDWNGAHQEAGEALRLNPFLASARRFRIQCDLQRNDPQHAEEELKTLIAINPSERESLQLWFARERQQRIRK